MTRVRSLFWSSWVTAGRCGCCTLLLHGLQKYRHRDDGLRFAQRCKLRCCPAMPPRAGNASPTRPGCGGTLPRVGTESHAGLIEAIQRFLDDAVHARERSYDDPRPRAEVRERVRGERPISPVQALAQSMAALPACVEVNALARKASLSAGYLFPEPGGRLPVPAGRPLDVDALISTGLVVMVSDPSDADLQAVASDLAGYLAGPPVDIWDYAVIDGGGTPSGPHPGRGWVGIGDS